MAFIQALSPDLLLQIVSHLRSEDHLAPSPEDLVTVSALARVCRRFSEPALDMLWGHLPSIVPLIFTMPRDLWVIEPREEKGGCRTLVVCPTTSPMYVITASNVFSAARSSRGRSYQETTPDSLVMHVVSRRCTIPHIGGALRSTKAHGRLSNSSGLPLTFFLGCVPCRSLSIARSLLFQFIY